MNYRFDLDEWLPRFPSEPQNSRLFELPDEAVARLQVTPYRGSLPTAVPTDPLIYRWYELVNVYGTTIKELIHEEMETATGSTPAVPRYTPKEGQCLAFIYYYAKLHRQAPSELDMQRYFQVSPLAVHDMVVKLDKQDFISRKPGMPRSIRLLLKREELPDLE